MRACCVGSNHLRSVVALQHGALFAGIDVGGKGMWKRENAILFSSCPFFPFSGEDLPVTTLEWGDRGGMVRGCRRDRLGLATEGWAVSWRAYGVRCPKKRNMEIQEGRKSIPSSGKPFRVAENF